MPLGDGDVPWASELKRLLSGVEARGLASIETHCPQDGRNATAQLGGRPEQNCGRDRRRDRLEARPCRTFSFVTVDVFTDRRFGGNPLAVFPDARGLSDADMQSLAAEFNLSETTFVLPPADPGEHRARAHLQPHRRDAVRRPSQCRHRLGAGAAGPRARTACCASRRSPAWSRSQVDARDGRHHRRAAAAVARARKCRPSWSPAASASRRRRGRRPAHRPVSASVGNSFVIAEVTGEALTRAAPDIAPLPRGRRGLSRAGAAPPAALPLCPRRRRRHALRARMFSPLSGTIEDAADRQRRDAAGRAAAVAHAGAASARYDIVQGVEMGRPSLLACTARRAADGIRASVGGGCVPVLKGEISL